MKSISSNPNAMSGLAANSININGKTYSTSASSSDTNNGNLSSDYTASIIIIVVSLTVSALIIFGVYFGIRQYDKRHRQRCLIDELSDQHSEDSSIRAETDAKKNEFKLTPRSTTLGGILSKNTNQVKPLVANNADTNRPPSTSVSVTTLDFTAANA